MTDAVGEELRRVEVNALIARLIYNVPFLVEIRDFLDRDFQVRVATLPGDEIRTFCSI